MDAFQNLIGGQDVPSGGAGRFEVRAALEPWEALGDFPRSGPPDVLEALVALEAPEGSALPAACAAELEGWRLDEELIELTSLRLGLAAEEWKPRPGGERRRPRRLAPVSRSEVAVLAPSWNRGAAGFLGPLYAELSLGRAVLLLPDARLPWIGTALAEDLLDRGLPGGRLALLHGITAEAWTTLLGSPRIGALYASGERARMRALRASVGRDVDVTLEADLTAGLVVSAGDDLEHAADVAVRAAFGRTESFSGQAGGQLGRVFCAESCYSRFTECLLERLESGDESSRALPQIDAAALARARGLEERGLDEGATLITGGEGDADAGKSRSLVCAPRVFTNVEPHGFLARHPDPVPVLALVRVMDAAIPVQTSSPAYGL